MPPRKPQTLASPKWTKVKSQGELAESVFVVKAQALGLGISEPKGDNQPFDFLVTTPLGTFRIQVKSSLGPAAESLHRPHPAPSRQCAAKLRFPCHLHSAK